MRKLKNCGQCQLGLAYGYVKKIDYKQSNLSIWKKFSSRMGRVEARGVYMRYRGGAIFFFGGGGGVEFCAKPRCVGRDLSINIFG